MNRPNLSMRQAYAGKKKKPEIKKETIIGVSSLLVLGIFIVCIQTRLPKFFEVTFQLTLAYICAVGFIFGEKHGAIFGILLGFLLDCVGGIGFSPFVVIYMLCGYFCGALKGKLLSDSLPSFLVFSAAAGVLNCGGTFMYHMLYAEHFSPIRVFFLISLPELIFYLPVCPVMYLLVFPISKIKIKQK